LRCDAEKALRAKANWEKKDDKAAAEAEKAATEAEKAAKKAAKKIAKKAKKAAKGEKTADETGMAAKKVKTEQADKLVKAEPGKADMTSKAEKTAGKSQPAQSGWSKLHVPTGTISLPAGLPPAGTCQSSLGALYALGHKKPESVQ